MAYNYYKSLTRSVFQIVKFCRKFTMILSVLVITQISLVVTRGAERMPMPRAPMTSTSLLIIPLWYYYCHIRHFNHLTLILSSSFIFIIQFHN